MFLHCDTSILRIIVEVIFPTDVLNMFVQAKMKVIT